MSDGCIRAFDILETPSIGQFFFFNEMKNRLNPGAEKESIRSQVLVLNWNHLLTSAGRQSEVGHQLMNRSKYRTFT